MGVATLEPPMAKKKQDKPTSREQTTSTRLNSEVMRKARMICAHRDIPMLDYLHSLFEPAVAKDYDSLMAELRKGK